MDAAMDTDSVLFADAVMEGGLRIDCSPNLDKDVVALSLEGDSPSVVAASAIETVAQDHGTTYSEVQLSHIKEMNDHLSSTILIGSVYSSAKELKELINDYGSKQGFQVSIASSSLKCLLAEEPKKNEKRREHAATIVPEEKRRSRSSPRCGCGFIVRFSPKKPDSVTATANGTKVAKPIKVTAVNFNHSNGCCPSAP
jgi:hypothetical protein